MYGERFERQRAIWDQTIVTELRQLSLEEAKMLRKLARSMEDRHSPHLMEHTKSNVPSSSPKLRHTGNSKAMQFDRQGNQQSTLEEQE